ncbi:uncharacterized protein ACIBXB_007810 [Morphnus guianensis]
MHRGDAASVSAHPQPPRRRSRSPRRAPSAAPGSSGALPPPPLRHGAAPPPLRASDTDPAVLLGAFPGTRRAIAQPRHGARVHHRGHKGDFFQREDRVIKSKVHYLLVSFRKRWSCLWVDLTRIPELQFCFLDLPGTSQSRRLELQRYTLTGIIFCFRERCEELCESRAMVLAENTSAPAGVRSTLDLVRSHSQGPVWVAKTVTEIRNKTP